MDNVIAILICISMGLIMAVSGVIVILVYRKKRKKYSDTVIGVSATWKSMQEAVPDDGVRRTYNYGVYEYEYQGNIYQATSIVGTTGNVKTGKKKKIYVDPNNPEDCMIDAWSYTFVAGMLFALAVLCIVIGCLLF